MSKSEVAWRFPGKHFGTIPEVSERERHPRVQVEYWPVIQLVVSLRFLAVLAYWREAWEMISSEASSETLLSLGGQVEYGYYGRNPQER